MKTLRIIFAGTPEFAAQQLQTLIDSAKFDIAAVYSQPDRKSGRGKKLKPTPVKVVAQNHGIPVYQPLSLKDETAQQELSDFGADLLVVVAYGMLLPEKVLNIPKLGCINIHASLLPRWRGAAPIERAIEAGDKETGITIMQMDTGLDTGDMLLKKSLNISDKDTGETVREGLSRLGSTTLLEVLEQFGSNSISRERQNDQLANYAAKLNKREAELDWQQNADLLALKIRAFHSSNVCYSQLEGERIKIWFARPSNEPSKQKPGTILAANKEGIKVACGTGVIILTELQLAGGKRLSVADILNSKAELFEIGKRFDNIEIAS